MTAIMPIFYADVAGKGLDGSTTTALWGYTQSLGTLLVVLLSPILGAIADKAHSKKKFLAFFTYMGVIATLLMWFIGEGQWVLASFLVILGTLAFSGGNVFYDAFLSDLVPEEKRDMVSSQGYAAGYIGGGLILILDLAMISYPQAFLLPGKLFATQLSFALVGIWWLVFSIPFFRHVQEKGTSGTADWKDMKSLAREGFESVKQTLMEIGRYPELLKFLIAFWFFSDGIDTIVKMAAIYGREVGVGQNDLILALVITQFVGIPCTLLFGRIAENLGAMRTLIITLMVYLFITILAYFMNSAFDFYLLAILVGFVQGGSQALARSIFSRLVPPDRNAEFFGFFGLSGKLASLLGPFVFGFVSQLTGASRLGIVSIALFFLAGIIILQFVDLEKGRVQALANSKKIPLDPRGPGVIG